MQPTDAVVIPIILAVVEGVKRTGYLPNKFTPILAVIVGALASVFVVGTGEWVTDAVNGVIYGLSASGLYSASKTMVK